MKTPAMPSCKYIFSVLVFALLTSEGICAQYFVRTSGNDRNSGTSRNSAFRTISQAISVANGNDFIYVGAGTYKERAVQSQTTAPRSIRLIGDITGARTGDKGEVIVQSGPSQYSIYFFGGRAVFIQDITFTSQRQDAPGGGIYVNGAKSYVYLYRCKMNNLQTAVFARNCGYVYGYKSEYAENWRGVYAEASKYALSYDCNYDNCRTAFHAARCDYTQVYRGKITNDADADGNTKAHLGIHAGSGQMSVYGITIENVAYGIHAPSVDRGSFQGVNIKNPRSYGIYAKGAQLSASSINVEGVNQRGWGIRLRTDTIPPKVQSVRCSNLYGGIYAGEVPSSYQNSTISNNRFGLYIPGLPIQYAAGDMSGLSITENQYGIYSVRAQSGKSLSIANAKLDKNLYGITSFGDTDLNKCEITNGRYGIRIYEGNASNISNCNVVGDPAEIKSSEGIYVASNTISVQDTSSTNCRSGLRIKLTGSHEPKLQNIDLTKNTTHGLYVDGGNISLAKQNNLVIDGCLLGIYCVRSNALVDDCIPTNSGYPYTFLYGSAKLQNATVTKALYGIRSYYQDSFGVSNTESRECEYGGAYIYGAKAVSVSKSQFNDGLRHGILVYNPVELSISQLTANRNKHHGLYIRAATTPKKAEIHDCNLSNNYYGLYTQRVEITPATVSRLTIAGCRYAVRALNSGMEVTGASQWKLDDNYYAISSYQGSVTCSKLELENNDVNLLTQQSPAKISDSKMSSRNINILLYSGNSSVTNCLLDSGRYGVYFAPRSEGTDLSLERTEINNATSIGFFAYGDRGANIPKVKIDGLAINKAGHGIYSYYSDIDAANTVISSPQRYGLYQVRGNMSSDGIEITSGSSWGIVSSGDTLSLRKAVIGSRYGVHLTGKSSTLVNSVIKGSTYGVYARGGQHQLLQSTVANVTNYGVYLRDGDMVVKNTIIDAGRFGLYNANTASKLEHDYNLISADGTNFVNATAGLHEIEKEPIFADPLKGDLHLAAGSPAINAGLDLSGISTTDIEGNQRPSFRQFEIGAYEFTENAGSLRILDWEEKSK